MTAHPSDIESFPATLKKHDLDLRRDRTTVLQVNVGFLCNQACRHCHLEAGPARSEVMTSATMAEVVSFAVRHQFEVVDVTGGAPEMVPGLDLFLRKLARHANRLMLRSNLTAIAETQRQSLMELCAELGVVIVASFPSVNESQTDAQRGAGVWKQSLETLQRLNALGYGRSGSGLELDLVSNPSGAYLPVKQAQAEKKFKRDLARKFGLDFNRLYTFANVPLGRYRSWLKESGNLQAYLQKLADGFNPCTIDGLMCRNLISVSWDGHVYDCDFNLAAGYGMGGRTVHLRELADLPPVGAAIATGDHCYACTAGAGFT